MEIFFFWILLSIVPAVIAKNKGLSGGKFFFLSVLLSPVVGIIAAWASKPDVKAIESRQISKGEARKCPHCAEMIKTEAKVCRFCGKDVPAPVDPFAPSP